MKVEHVDQALHQRFVTEGARLVFWHDTEAEFTEYIERGLSGELESVQVLEVAKVGGLSAKLLLEREDPTSKYLVYSVGESPRPEDDWLLDIRLYSTPFHADAASLWLQELRLGGKMYLRDHLRARAAFMANQERRKKLAHLVTTDDDETALDMKMMAVLVGSSVANPMALIQSLCHGHVHEGRFDLGAAPAVMATLEKMDLLAGFWELMRGEFQFVSDNPSVAGLLRKLFVSEMLHDADGAGISALAHFDLPPTGRRNAAVCLTQWRDSSGKASSYDATAAAIAAELKLEDHLKELDLPALKDVFTFWDAEKRFASLLKRRVLDEEATIDVEAVVDLASERKAGHWLSGHGRDRPGRRALADAYDAIVSAAELFALRAKHKDALTFETPEDFLAAYFDELYRFDWQYRRFCAMARPAHGQGWDLLKELAERVEQVYQNGFLQPLGTHWGTLLDNGFLERWSCAEFPNQRDFYGRYIQPHLDEAEKKRAYVIISDAFRYEAAQEFTKALNGRYRMNAEIDAMLGALPSYTALGMASLLPHDTLAYNEKGDVLADGARTAGTEARGKHLAAFEGMACQAEDLVTMKQKEAREFTDGCRVVYIYHNVIDARGDHAATEGETFQAVSDCIDGLVELVQFCINKLNASKVWVTADHGFLFQQDAPQVTEQSKLSFKPDQAVTLKKRYVIGPNLGAAAEGHRGSIETTSGAQGGMEFWIPRGINRFHFTGGARFVHGGAMPQEIMVPVVTVKQLRGKQQAASRTERVGIQVLGSNHKITTPKYRFEVIQTEKVSERRRAANLRAAIYDGLEAVTTVESFVCDSDSDNIEDRKKSFLLELRSGTYEKTKPYRLVLRDADNDAEVESIPVVIDRSFDDDF
jgi:uncharacterized protein (TIGR02687 family)